MIILLRYISIFQSYIWAVFYLRVLTKNDHDETDNVSSREIGY